MSTSPFNPSHYVRQGISFEMIQSIKQAFDLFDFEQSGSVNTKQLQAAMSNYGFEQKNNTIYRMISEIDSEGNGNINFQQWLCLMTPKATKTNTRTHYDRVFQMYDNERTGFISANNIKRVVQELGMALSDRQIQELIWRADLDEDGLVSQEEFYHLMTYRK